MRININFKRDLIHEICVKTWFKKNKGPVMSRAFINGKDFKSYLSNIIFPVSLN